MTLRLLRPGNYKLDMDGSFSNLLGVVSRPATFLFQIRTDTQVPTLQTGSSPAFPF